jgi:serine/threonine protein kinase
VHAVNSMRANYVTCQNSMDIWSMGVIMYEVITAEPFFPIDADRDAMRDGLVGLEPLPFEEDRRSLLRGSGGFEDGTAMLKQAERRPWSRAAPVHP